MNDRLLEFLLTDGKLHLAGDDKPLVEFFVEYLDHGSLFMVGFEPGDDPTFVFTNDAQRYRFTLNEIRGLVHGMKSGVAMKWEEVPFEYITR